MFDIEHCSPRNEKIEISCYDNNILKKIGRIINKKSKNKTISLNCGKDKLYHQLSNYFKNQSSCKTEICWIKELHDHLNKQEYKHFLNHFRPIMPPKWKINKNEWLTTIDIDNVLSQYQKKYPYFKYMGANPIDFSIKSGRSCLTGGELCKININRLKKKYKNIGAVFNIDPSTESGQHWFSLYIDLVGKNRKKKPTIYYFDSAQKITKKNIEERIPEEIQELVKKIQKQNKNFDFLFNDCKHQYQNTECGIYCIHFLTEMLRGVPFKKYLRSKLNDNEMEQFRSKFFIHVK